MKSYVDVISFLNTQIAMLNQSQADQLMQILIQDFIHRLPKNWLQDELADEQRFYQKLAHLLLEDRWDMAKISAQIAGLDAIMDAMGEDYPHSTDAYPLALLTMVDYYLLFLSRQADNDVDFHGFVMGVVDEYMTMADFEAQADDNDHWLDYPPVAQAFENVKNVLATAKSSR